jgi:hypothetical protein
LQNKEIDADFAQSYAWDKAEPAERPKGSKEIPHEAALDLIASTDFRYFLCLVACPGDL